MERKSNAQLKQLIEQKDRPSSTSCDKCSDLKQLLELEKQNNQQLIEQQKVNFVNNQHHNPNYPTVFRSLNEL